MDLKRRLFSQSAVIFAARVLGAGLIFAVQAVMARTWGSAALGEYLVVIATVNLSAVMLPLGFQTIGTYFAAEYRARGQRRQLWRFMARAYGHVALAGLVLFILFEPLAGLIGTAGEAVALLRVPVTVFSLATALVFVNGALLVGLKRPYAGFFAEALVRPLLVIAAFGLALVLGSGEPALAALLWVLGLCYLGVALVQFVAVAASVGTVAREKDIAPNESRRWWRFAAPWVMIALATDYFFDLDLLFLARLMDHEQLAVFGIAARIFALVSFGVAAVYAVTLPDMFEAEARNDRDGFMRKIGDANLVAAGLAALLFAGAALGGPFVLLLFGPAFLAGSGPLAVLCLGLVVRSLFGPASLVLSIHDRPYASLPAIGLGLGVLAAGNVVLVPALGLMGAALAALIAITIWSAALWLTAWRVAKVDVSIVPKLRASGLIRAQKDSERS